MRTNIPNLPDTTTACVGGNCTDVDLPASTGAKNDTHDEARGPRRPPSNKPPPVSSPHLSIPPTVSTVSPPNSLDPIAQSSHEAVRICSLRKRTARAHLSQLEFNPDPDTRATVSPMNHGRVRQTHATMVVWLQRRRQKGHRAPPPSPPPPEILPSLILPPLIRTEVMQTKDG